MRQLSLVIGLLLAGAPAQAGPPRSTPDQLIAELQRRLEAQEARIRQLEERLGATTSVTEQAAAPPLSQPSSVAVASVQRPDPASNRLKLSGDLRLRHESNFGESGARRRDREVLRARLRGAYKATDWLTAGAQIVVGDPNDPNSTDVTLSGFDDDLPVSLDQAYLMARSGGFEAVGGKFPLPFVRTDLVWDGDISPQGAALTYARAIGGDLGLKLSGLYFAVDESVGGANSEMLGAQLSAASASGGPWRLEAALGYYDYRLSSLAGADAGDFRTNLLTPSGRYLSDFNLIDVVAAATYTGFSDRWPLRLTADYVKNLGAATPDDEGFSVDLSLGRLSDRRDWRLSYGYSQTEADAVLAAFSHDNTTIATNYIQHAMSIDYLLARNLLLNATFYHYRPKSTLGDVSRSLDWRDRLRLQLMVSF